MNDLYNILGVSLNATTEEIKHKFRFLAQAYHPDKFASDEHRKQAEEQFKIISAAYQILSNPEKRARYDSEQSAKKVNQPQGGDKQSPKNNTQNYAHPKPKAQATGKASQLKNNKKFPIWVGVSFLGMCGFVFSCFFGLSLLNSNPPANIPNTATSYETVTPRPIIPTDTIFITPTTLSTFTPAPISSPVPTLIRESIVITPKNSGDGKWEVVVEKILFTDKLTNPILGNTDKAAGRFAIVFIQATNRGLSQDFYCSCFEFEIQDAEGNNYETNLSATQSAQAIYNSDSGFVNPDNTLHTVTVFDISLQSASYTLVTGSLYQSDSPGLLLNLP